MLNLKESQNNLLLDKFDVFFLKETKRKLFDSSFYLLLYRGSILESEINHILNETTKKLIPLTLII